MYNSDFYKLRYFAGKFGVKIRRVKNNAYKFISVDKAPAENIDGVNCSGVMTIEDVKNVIAEIAGKKTVAEIKNLNPVIV